MVRLKIETGELLSTPQRYQRAKLHAVHGREAGTQVVLRKAGGKRQVQRTWNGPTPAGG